MNQRQLFSLIAFTFLASSSIAAIQNGDFLFAEEGETAFIEGVKGAPLHIRYIGPDLTAPLKVKVTPDDAKLKLSPSTCMFTGAREECRLTVHLSHSNQKVYGVHQFTVTEVGGLTQLDPTGISASEDPLTFGVGILEKDMPAPVTWFMKQEDNRDQERGSALVILANSTTSTRTYRGTLSQRRIALTQWYEAIPQKVSVPPKSVCYLDQAIVSSSLKKGFTAFYIVGRSWDYVFREIFEDITDPSNPISNSPFNSANNNLSSCSASSWKSCTSGTWGSMSVGLANIGSQNLKANSSWATPSDDIRAGEVKVIPDNSWGNGSNIYFEGAWTGSSLALLLIQGSTDGSGFDAKSAAPSIQQIKSAPPCSSYMQK